MLTHVSGRPTRSGHHVSAGLHLGQTKVTDHDLGFILRVKVQQVLRLRKEKRTRMETRASGDQESFDTVNVISTVDSAVF